MDQESSPLPADELLPLVYDELRRLAASQLSQERPGQTWQATELVHEAYVRLTSGDESRRWADRRHFVSAAALAIRHLLVDRARAKKSLKRGGELHRNPLVELNLQSPVDDERLLDLDEALSALEQQHAEAAKLVQLRFFAGQTLAEAAETLGISARTAGRHWSYAQAWLKLRLNDIAAPP